MSESKDKFKQLLSELFQFDLADLDFGIYRIMNHKRQVIERWITEDLPRAIQEELSRGALAEQQQAQQALEEARQKVLETLGEDAIDAEGNLAEPYSNTKVGREYLEAREKAAHAQPAEALEAQVYNHLYTFFSRYYQDGDFISRRRYSRKERYAIPYNGEDVYLYWANHDQYYVKTAEHFTDYTYKAPNGVTVHFKLRSAHVEVNNVKGEERFFLPVLDDITWDAETRTLTIPFQYRPLTKEEKQKYGVKQQQNNQTQDQQEQEQQNATEKRRGNETKKIQESIIAQSLKDIHDQLKGNAEALGALTAERRRDAHGNPVSYLEHHLRQYTARNTRDFFIHKDLKGFLSRELDFYLKNEVLNLDELEAAGEDLADGWFQLMRLIKRIGNHIIDFLAQIEDFQKALWEKKKFITETFWCITVGHIPEDFYPEIAANEAQWEEWRELFYIHELPRDIFSGDLNTKEGRIDFLKAHPTLVVDTRHFSQDFTDRLLASFDNLDEMTDGLLVHSENWQALNLLLEKYRERVKTIYIDPPYNTEQDRQQGKFLYKDSYEHSSWLSLMYNSSFLASHLMSNAGTFASSIDDNEVHNLDHCFQSIFNEQKIGELCVIRAEGGGLAKKVVKGHDYLLIYARDLQKCPPLLRPKEIRGKVIEKNGEKFWIEEDWLRVEFGKYGTLYYEDIEKVKGAEKKKEIDDGIRSGKYVLIKKRKKHIVGRLRPLEYDGTKFYSVIKYLNAQGVDEVVELFGYEAYDYPKPLGLVKFYVLGSTFNKEWRDGIILDYFAGSGTTGHAVINLNREDGGRRRFILVEMGEYFDTVLLPRIKKVTFTPEWKDGKPERTATQEEFERGPRIVKVIRLESYEDALNNITFDEESGNKALDLFGDEYLLRYMLRWESKKSETFLDVEQLQAPFSYRLRIHRDGETREQPVDLPETFAYLIGLDVERRQVLHDGDRRYLIHRGTTRNGRRVAVIWRETKGWMQADYERDARFVAEQGLTEGADEVFVNGDSYIPGARSLDGVFKARLFGQEG